MCGAGAEEEAQSTPPPTPKWLGSQDHYGQEEVNFSSLCSFVQAILSHIRSFSHFHLPGVYSLPAECMGRSIVYRLRQARATVVHIATDVPD